MNKACLAIFSIMVSSTILSMESDIKKTSVDLNTIKSMCETLYRKVQADGFNPALLVGIARGGLVPLGLLAGETMFNNRNAISVNTASYDDTNRQGELKLLFPLHTEDYEAFKSLLLVDDVADTGETIEQVCRLLKEKLPNTTIKTATLFYKPKSKMKPDYHVTETTDWIIFPWEG